MPMGATESQIVAKKSFMQVYDLILTVSPISDARLGATESILLLRYSASSFQ